MSAPKRLFIFYNSVSLWLTENLHEFFFLKTRSTCFVCDFSVKCIIKKNYLPLFGPLKVIVNYHTKKFDFVHPFYHLILLDYFIMKSQAFL